MRKKRTHNSIKTEVDGIKFDSQTEAQFYKHLLWRDDVKDIELQPQFVFMELFEVDCWGCVDGKVESPKTGNPINCKRCGGTGKRSKQPWTFTADFRVIWDDGREDIIDVKGYSNERFPLVKKMFEYQHGKELMIVKKQRDGWAYS